MADRYEIKGRLGRGGIGAVYQAFDHHLGRDVAIKRLLPLEETQLNNPAENSLELEAKALAALSHPNIVTIFEFGEDEQGPFVVFELIEGDTLKDLISEGALSETDFYDVTDQILDALISAQKMNILHRDIKPANIMLSWLPSGKFQIKMLDFGLSKFAQEPSTQTLDQQGSFLGSIDYIAPEQIELFPLDQRTDLYSLGCVLYYALTQRSPFTGDSMAQTMNNHLAGKALPLEELRPDIPIAVCRWVMSLISLHPSDRPSNAMEAMEGLTEAKKTANQSITDSISTAKLVVPVVTSAQPMMIPRTLEHTQQIVTTPALMESVVPPHPNSEDSTLITGRYKPKAKAPGPSRGAILGLVGSILALLIVGGVAINNDRKGRQAEDKKMSVAATTTTPTETTLDNEAGPGLIRNTGIVSDSSEFERLVFLNSGRPIEYPELPKSESLVAYYSVGGLVQNIDGKPFDFESDTEEFGALDNLVPGADEFHIAKRPDDPDRAPQFGSRWKDHKTIFFEPGEKLSPNQRALKQGALASDKYCYVMVVRIPADGFGNLFRTNYHDVDENLIKSPIKLSFFNTHFGLSSEYSKEVGRLDFEPEKYIALFVDADFTEGTLSISQRTKGPDNTVFHSDPISVDLKGIYKTHIYEFGNLTMPNKTESWKKIEMQAFALYTDILTEVEKRRVSAKMFELIGPKKKNTDQQ